MIADRRISPRVQLCESARKKLETLRYLLSVWSCSQSYPASRVPFDLPTLGERRRLRSLGVVTARPVRSDRITSLTLYAGFIFRGEAKLCNTLVKFIETRRAAQTWVKLALTSRETSIKISVLLTFMHSRTSLAFI